MKKSRSMLAAAAALLLACAAGSADARSLTVIHVATYSTASLPLVMYPVQRVERHWVPGRWEWNGVGHVWVPGHWQMPPRAYSYAD
ncbi:MAG TPA: YXWGXW repeat-containing protein [Ramlibacter sp.]|nr:YXWGXW repeat-containing protein [Ramlibacter sp.]